MLRICFRRATISKAAFFNRCIVHSRTAPTQPNLPVKTTTTKMNTVSAASAVSTADEMMPVHAAARSIAGFDRVPDETINAALAKFKRQFRIWSDREDRIDGADECHGIRVVIALGVTSAMVEKTPYKLLVSLVVDLSADGVLELIGVEGSEHRQAKAKVFTFLDAYGEEHSTPANGLVTDMECPGIYRGIDAKPDCVLLMNFRSNGMPGDEERELPIVVVEIEVHNRTVPELIQQARLYLSEEHVLRVVLIKFFDSRKATEATGCLKKAALAIVLEREETVFQPGVLARVRVVQEVSFGTAALDGSVEENLSKVSSRWSDEGVIRSIASSPSEAHDIWVNTINAAFPQLPQHDLVVDLTPRLAAPLTFGLHKIFLRAALGWKQDDAIQRLARAQ